MSVLVIGAGKSGVAAANFLVARGEAVSIADSSQHPEVPFPLDDRVRRFFGYQDETALNSDKVRYVGDAIAAVAAVDEETAERPRAGERERVARHRLPATELVREDLESTFAVRPLLQVIDVRREHRLALLREERLAEHVIRTREPGTPHRPPSPPNPPLCRASWRSASPRPRTCSASRDPR